MSTASDTSESVYNRIVTRIFSGEIAPGTKLVERTLADELGVSRIPVRETLAKLVAEGMLVGGEKRQGVRLRAYSTEDVRQLYEFRELLEGGAARAAAMRATDADVARMEMICDQAEADVGNYGSLRWAGLDHQFHEAMGEASHNERLIKPFKRLLMECHYIFYLYPARQGRPRPRPQDAEAHMRAVLNDHRTLLNLIRSRDAEAAEHKARQDMRASGERATRALIASDLLRQQGGGNG